MRVILRSNEKYLSKEYLSDYDITHREDGPALILSSGQWTFYSNGIPSNENGPAIRSVAGSYVWYVNGVRHRLNGPCIDTVSGRKVWFDNDCKVWPTLEG